VQEKANFKGCEWFWPEFSQTCPKKFCAKFCANIFSSRTSFGMTSRKRSSCDSANVRRHFAQIFRNFAEVVTNFTQIYTGFARIFKYFARIFNRSNILGCACTAASFSTDAAIQWLLIAVNNTVLYCVQETRGKM